MEKQGQYIKIKDRVFKPFISKERIKELVSTLADRINEDYNGKNPLFLIVLKGAIIFASDLLRNIDLDCEMEMLKAESYGNNITSSGKVQLFYNGIDIKNRDVIIVEDIIDSGLTLKTLIKNLTELSPSSIETVSLLSKTEMRKNDVNVKYVGIEIPSLFVVGYGLDYAEQGRNLEDIYSLYNE